MPRWGISLRFKGYICKPLIKTKKSFDNIKGTDKISKVIVLSGPDSTVPKVASNMIGKTYDDWLYLIED